MNIPFSLNFDRPNNATMKSLSLKERMLDLPKALEQFQVLYGFVSGQAHVYLLPSVDGFQDQTYVSNVAAYLPHCSVPTIILSNFRSKPRIGEERIAGRFFELFGYAVHYAPRYFEGEADLKHLAGKVYVGAHGMRTSKEALDWLQVKFDMQIIPIEIVDPRAYHLDCLVFPVDRQHTLICTSLVEQSRISQLERHTSIIDVSYGETMAMATNCLRVGDYLCAQSNIHLFSASDEMYGFEKQKIAKLEQIACDLGLRLKFFDLSEFRKSGAALSCLAMRLNDRAIDWRSNR